METSVKSDSSNTAIPMAGRIDIELYLIALGLSNERQIEGVKITNSRSKNIGRLLVGLTPNQALQRIRVLFSLCSQAQQAAAYSALTEATGRPFESGQQQHLVERCTLEWLKEHSWQLWMMMRSLFNEDYAKTESIAITQLLLKELQILPNLSLNDQSLASIKTDWSGIKAVFTPMFGLLPREFLTLSWIELMGWAKTDSPYAKLWSEMLDVGTVNLGNFKHWERTAESGPLGRTHQPHPLIEQSMAIWGPSLVTRTLAKLVELAQACVNPQIAAPIGMGVAQSSRGQLKHTVLLDQNGCIEHYDIDAPTDRHFCRNGLVEKSLLGQTIATHQFEMVKQLVWAIDPCVEFDVKLFFGNKEITN